MKLSRKRDARRGVRHAETRAVHIEHARKLPIYTSRIRATKRAHNAVEDGKILSLAVVVCIEDVR